MIAIEVIIVVHPCNHLEFVALGPIVGVVDVF